MITLEQGVELVWQAFGDMRGGEIYVKKIPSMTLVDIAKAVAPDARHEIIGIRPGEKIHEQMIGMEDAPHSYDYEGHYKILPAIHNGSSDSERIGNGKKLAPDFEYTSGENTEWMPLEALRGWIETHPEMIVTV